MKLIRPLLFAALLGLSAVPLAAADVKAIYDKDCAKCHGADGRGRTESGKRLGARDYTDPKVVDSLDEAKAIKAIRGGLRDKNKVLMKPFDKLSTEDIRALIDYMRQFKK